MDEMQMDRARLLEELRQRAQELDYRESVPFEAVEKSDAPDETKRVSFDPAALDRAFSGMDKGASVLYYRPLSGGSVRTFFRKVIRKLLFFLLEPMSQDASAFNIASVRAAEQLCAFAREQAEENEKNLRRIEALEKRIEELEKGK